MRSLLKSISLLCLLTLTIPAAITVDGLTTKNTYTGNVTFTVPSETGFTIVASLNEITLTLDSPITENTPGYHELSVTKTPEAGGVTEDLTIQFIVRDPNRPASDNGISTWTPRPPVDTPAPLLDTTNLTFVTPAAVTPGMNFPLVVRLETVSGDIACLNATALVSDSSGNATPLKLRRGAGAGAWLAPAIGPFTLTLHLGGRTFSREIAVASPAVQTLSGELTASQTFATGSVVDITADTTLPADTTLRFEEGCLVRLAADATVEILGTLEVAGTLDNPVVFLPASNQPWGGFFLRGGSASADIQGAFFTGGGAEAGWTSTNGFSAHRKEQPILTFDAGTSGGICIAKLTDTWIVDNPSGQAGHGRNASITFERCLIQRTNTVGQYNGGGVNFYNSHALEFPIDNSEFSDDDNDGLYLTGGAHHIRGSVIGWAKDDGIDCGGTADATLLVEDSWIDSCFHEGFALSGDKVVTINNTVSINNGQGLEVGYSGSLNRPDATATNMLIVGNAHGARYGDNYNWTYNGKLNVSSSLLLQNRKDVFGVEYKSWNYREADMTIENNVFTSSLSKHPTNVVLDPPTHSPQIASFLDGGFEPRGFAIIERSPQNSRADYGGQLSLHLDRPAAEAVTIPWRIVTQDAIVTTGMLEFPPGQTFATLSLPSLAAPHDSAPWIAVHFDNSPTAIQTGPSSCHFLDLPGDSTPTETKLVTFSSDWRYLGDGSDQATAWREAAFDDSIWPTGAGQLGYGDNDEETDVGYTGTSTTKNATTYFRHQFEVPDPTAFSSLNLDLLFDDGAVIYLNGTRIAAANMPAGDPAFDFYIGSTSTDNERETFTIAPANLTTGTNTLAVEIHQEGMSSSDISFDLELTALPAENTINSLFTNLSTGRFLFWATDGVIPQASTDLQSWINRPDLISPLTITPASASPPSQFFRLMKP